MNAPLGANVANLVTGPLSSPVGGRTDHLPISVPEGAYIIPADVVSSLGQGNTQSGMLICQKMFGAPWQPGSGRSVDIMAAGGEFVVSPAEVAKRGGGDLASGHAVFDSWVKMERADNISKLKKMPPPVKSGR